jgi:predicted CopG family antitoxin
VTITIKTIDVIESIDMSTDALTTIPVRASTRAELQRLKSGGQSYDEVIRAILEELEEQDPWFQEMEQRLKDIHSGKSKLEPIESLYAKYPPSRARRSSR